MKFKCISFLLLCGLIFNGSQRSFKLKSKYKHLKLIADWVFLSMETTTYNEEKDKDIVMQSDGTVETLSFHRSGSMSYFFMSNGKEEKGRGIWMVEDEKIKIMALEDTIQATYSIDNGILTLITSEDETEDFYGYTSIVKYKKK